MLKKHMIAVATAASFLSMTALAQGQYGSAAEAKAMLEKAVAAVKADKTKAFEMFNKGEGGFKDRDLYPFCGNASDGTMTAHPSPQVRAMKMADIKDKTGYALGAEMMKVAAEGKFAEVSYKWPRPGSEEPVDKVSFVTKVGDQVCGVGYYK
jgi:signal transduction histidine kinase